MDPNLSFLLGVDPSRVTKKNAKVCFYVDIDLAETSASSNFMTCSHADLGIQVGCHSRRNNTIRNCSPAKNQSDCCRITTSTNS